MRSLWILCAVGTSLACSAVAMADDWVIRMTVDNQYSAYYGTATATTGFVGADNNWFTMETYTVTGRAPTDYWYVATASDRSVAQGFLGSFTNITTGVTILTGQPEWEVFRAGDHLQQIFGMSGPWPANVLPTQPQIDAAIAYATALNLWVPAVSWPGYTNPGAGPWSAFPAISSGASWIWAPAAGGGNPLQPGANHGEFLVFRIVGEAVPTPGAAVLLGLGGLVASRRRR
jgi:MYXO-CTERM domain-containing protein